MKQQSSSSRVRKQVQTQRDEYLATVNQMQGVNTEKQRGFSSNSANQAKNQSNGSNKQRTPIKLLQAKHRHLEVQLAKLSAEVAQQSRENNQTKIGQRSSSNNAIVKPADQFNVEYNYASPTNLHLMNDAIQQNVGQSPIIQKVQPERSGSNNSAKRKKIIKMQSIQQIAATKSTSGLANVHIPGSDASGQALAAYAIQGNVLNEDRSTFSPVMGQKTKIKIERKKIQGSGQPSLFDFNIQELSKKNQQPSSNQIRMTSQNQSVNPNYYQKGNPTAPPKPDSAGNPKKSSGPIHNQGTKPLKAYFYPAQIQKQMTDQELSEENSNILVEANNHNFEFAAYENNPNEIAVEMANQNRMRANSRQPMSNTPKSLSQNINQSGLPQHPATTRHFEQLGRNAQQVLSPQINRGYSSHVRRNNQDSLLQGSSTLPEEFNVQEKQQIQNGMGQTLEVGIMNLHNNLKNLEGKYIDLANFYKQELLTKQRNTEVHQLKVGTIQKKNIQSLRYQQNNQLTDKTDLTTNDQQNERAFAQNVSKGIENEIAIRKIFSLDEATERQKIDAVKQEKLKLESQLKGFILLQNRLNELGDIQNQTDPLTSLKLADFSMDISEGL